MNRSKHIFLFFIGFHCSQLSYCSPCPTAAPASLNMHVMSTNFAKTLVCKREYDVILWRHKQRVSSKNDQHTPLLYTRIRKGASNQAVAPGITRPLHATDYMLSRFVPLSLFRDCPRPVATGGILGNDPQTFFALPQFCSGQKSLF